LIVYPRDTNLLYRAQLQGAVVPCNVARVLLPFFIDERQSRIVRPLPVTAMVHFVEQNLHSSSIQSKTASWGALLTHYGIVRVQAE